MFSYVRSNIRSIMIDRLSDQGQLNSHYSQNSQTLHESDIESTVDTFERAIKIHKGA